MRPRMPGLGLTLRLGFVLSCASLVGAAATPQTSPRPQDQLPQQQTAPLIRSVEGPDLYRAYCASCHGLHAKGDGPVAPFLKVGPPDLTLLTKNNKGQFPLVQVRKIILGDAVVASHGTREMPIWGPIFHQVEADVDRGNVRVENLLKYLESIQSIQVAPAKNSAGSSPTGPVLYKQLCAACHGNDLKGGGPGPAPFNDVPPDLTTLARRHGGKFPDEYVIKVLRNGVVVPAHEPPEMPTWDADFKAGYGLSEPQVALRIANLTNYIKSLQAKPSGN